MMNDNLWNLGRIILFFFLSIKGQRRQKNQAKTGEGSRHLDICSSKSEGKNHRKQKFETEILVLRKFRIVERKHWHI